MNQILTDTLLRCEGFCELKMWEAAWEELEALPTELKQYLSVLTWRMQILMGMGEHQKASFIGLSLVQKFPERLGLLLSTAECLINCKDHHGASCLVRSGLSRLPDNPDLWADLGSRTDTPGRDGGRQGVRKPLRDLEP